MSYVRARPNAVLPRDPSAVPPPPAGRAKRPLRYDRDDRVERLLKNGFAERVRRFQAEGVALELEEIPQVLDGLLDLNCTELEQLIERLGLESTELRHADGSPLGRITPDYVIQLLGGNRHGGFNVLPTTPAQATHALEALAVRAQDLTRKMNSTTGPAREQLRAQAAELHERRAKLLAVRDRLRDVPRARGWQELGMVGTVMLRAGKENPLGENGPWRGKLMGYSSSVGVGFGLSRVDRHTGKRRFVPYAQITSDMVAGGVTYTLKKDERTVDTSFRPYFFTIGTSPVCGRHIYFAPPLGFSFTIGERFLGIGLPLNRFRGGKMLVPGRHLDVDPILMVGIRGDPVQNFTNPVIRWCFRTYEALKRRRSPRRVESNASSTGVAHEDWLPLAGNRHEQPSPA